MHSDVARNRLWENTLLRVPRLLNDDPRSTNGNRPARLQNIFDPVKIILALNVQVLLRQVAYFSEAVAAAQEYEIGDVVAPRDASKDPSRKTLIRAYTRIDIVSMNIERRHWEADMAIGNIIAVQIYTDASLVIEAEM